MTRPSLTVLTGAQARLLVLRGRRAVGVEIQRGDAVEYAEAAGEVILATGAVGSPHLLQLSGIGPGDVLRDHGIEVVHDLPGVGENLQDHLQLRMIYKVTGAKTINEIDRSWFAKAQIAFNYALFRRGALTMAP